MESAPRRPVPVFPLPNMVLFPRTMLPLQVFEARYRAMLRDALAGDRLIVMALLRPGWERDYYGSPAFYEVGCLGRCEQVEWRPDDRYELKLVGLSRVRLGRVEREFPYRSVRVQPIPQAPWSEDDPLIQSEGHALKELCKQLSPTGLGSALETLGSSAGGGFEVLVNTLSMVLTMPPADKQELLEMDSLVDRCRRVRELVQGGAGG